MARVSAYPIWMKGGSRMDRGRERFGSFTRILEFSRVSADLWGGVTRLILVPIMSYMYVSPCRCRSRYSWKFRRTWECINIIYIYFNGPSSGVSRLDGGREWDGWGTGKILVFSRVSVNLGEGKSVTPRDPGRAYFDAHNVIGVCVTMPVTNINYNDQAWKLKRKWIEKASVCTPYKALWELVKSGSWVSLWWNWCTSELWICLRFVKAIGKVEIWG
jgi:hypothetical protein